MEIVWRKAAAKKLRQLTPKRRKAINAIMKHIAEDPFGRHPQAMPLKGSPDGFRLRYGDWRVLYKVDREAEVVVVAQVRHRGE